MKAAIYNPYLDTLGGGERYTMAVATALREKGYKVDIQWKEKSIIKRLEERFGIDLSEINFVKDIERGDGYDICFWVSDGSIPLLRARTNLLHFQMPFKKVGGRSLLNRMKLFRINRIICNSKFTKHLIDKEFGVKSIVIYPPVSVEKFKAKRKEKLILTVGRFSQLTQAKRQDVLIRAFKRLYDLGRKDWILILAGGVDVGVDDYVRKLKDSAKGYPIKIIESPSFKEICDLYGRAKIYWSASGYNIDENENPDKVEHFGIAVVEATAPKSIVLAYNAGGHKEIIDNGENGFLWKTQKQLIDKTNKVLEDPSLLRKISIKARKDCLKFSQDKFDTKFSKLLM